MQLQPSAQDIAARTTGTAIIIRSSATAPIFHVILICNSPFQNLSLLAVNYFITSALPTADIKYSSLVRYMKIAVKYHSGDEPLAPRIVAETQN
jgi:hypothetical protein